MSEDKIREIIQSLTSAISSDTFKSFTTSIDNNFNRIQKQMGKKETVDINDYAALNNVYEQQAGLSYLINYKAYGDESRATKAAMDSLENSTDNLVKKLTLLTLIK